MHVGKIIKIPNIAMRIGISFLVVALLPLLIVSLRAFYLSEQILNDEVMARLSAITDSKAHQIELFFSEEQEHISLLGRNPDIHAALKLFTEAFVKDGVDSSSYNTADETYRSLFTYFKQSFGVHDLFLISPAGDIVFSVLREEDFSTNLKTGP